jgi:hypothetical protein
MILLSTHRAMLHFAPFWSAIIDMYKLSLCQQSFQVMCR